MTAIEKALERATDTKACLIADGAIAGLAGMFKEQFPGSAEAIVVADPRTWKAAGEQAKVLNRIVTTWRQEHHLPSVANLKELLGHTRTEVFGGMVTGIVTAIVVCRLWG